MQPATEQTNPAADAILQLESQGLVQVLEGRHCFGPLTVEKNLLNGFSTSPVC